MTQLTELQHVYLNGMTRLLASQFVVLMIVMWLISKYAPNRLCLFTCRVWTDIILYLIIAMALIWVIYSSSINRAIRLLAFYGLGVLMSYLLAVQYNAMRTFSKSEKELSNNFMMAVTITITFAIIVMLLLPFLLNNMSVIASLSSLLFFSLIILIIWGLVFGAGRITYVSVGLIIFMGLLITDMTMLVYACKSAKSQECDPLTGASTLYVDLINILQKIFIILNNNNQ